MAGRAGDPPALVRAGAHERGLERGHREETMSGMSALQRRAAHKSRGGSSVDLNLVSLIDVFTILIFFLLAQVGPIETLPSY